MQVQLSMPVMKVASGESGFSPGQSWEDLFLGLAQPWALQTSPASPAFPLTLRKRNHLVMLTVDGDHTLGSGEQGQLGHIPELFANRGGRQGLGRCLFVCF